ncbi:MAG: hypothetical protein LBB34_02340 [Holosporales bacterium]|jgi:hypothetical protein|nr:hypothetical protein [Holosporales bacterium]
MDKSKSLSDLQKKSLIIACTMTIVQCTKNWGMIKSVPTQIWSFVITLLLVLLVWVVQEISGDEDSDEKYCEMNLAIFLNLLFDAVLLSFASNGAYLAMYKLG